MLKGGDYMQICDRIEPIFYISDDNKKTIKEIEEILSLIKIDDSIKRKNLKML